MTALDILPEISIVTIIGLVFAVGVNYRRLVGHGKAIEKNADDIRKMQEEQHRCQLTHASSLGTIETTLKFIAEQVRSTSSSIERMSDKLDRHIENGKEKKL